MNVSERPIADSCRRRQRGQSLVEFAITAPILLLLLAGAIDFGNGYTVRLQVANAARVGARWASLHSGDVNQGWSSSSAPAENTIEGQVIYAGDTLSVINDDSHIQIYYYIWTQGTTTTTYCGRYSEATNSFVGGSISGGGSYTLSQCVAVDNIVQVTVYYDYPVLTPLFSSLFGPTISVGSQASFVIQS
ncbi:MAG TPA: TadE family protein [Candidatus Nitrosotalea sp.]|nr:TadE family protein [Candidatus Nitrosotalea sp.]